MLWLLRGAGDSGEAKGEHGSGGARARARRCGFKGRGLGLWSVCWSALVAVLGLKMVAVAAKESGFGDDLDE